MKNVKQLIFLSASTLALITGSSVLSATPKAILPLTPEGEKAFAEYSDTLKALRSELSPKLPKVEQEKADQFLAGHKNKRDTVTPSEDTKGVVKCRCRVK